ncbi:MAG: stage II sporulation protein R [Clostridia bacterium]|nr:stage II sporulation protein R [Clostridia bacterium]
MKTFASLMLSVLMMTTALAMALLPVHGEEAVYDSVIRLHVLANSDSEEDQALKLQVRDAVLDEAQQLLQGTATRAEAEAVLRPNLSRLQQAAAAVVAAAGFDDSVTVTLSDEDYPTRTYEQLAFPAGEYLSLRVMIGAAEGKNWWCVLFPPLCLSAATSREEAEMAFLAAGLTGEQYRIITDSDENTKYKLRFKLLEVAESIFRE